MRIYEHEAKQLLRQAGVSVPGSELASTAAQAQEAAQRLGGPVVLKPQTMIKARGKAGLIAFADTPQEAGQAAGELLGREHAGEKIDTLLVEAKVGFDQELYLGITVDYTEGCPVFIASSEGGVEIESVAQEHPERVIKRSISPGQGLTKEQAGEIADFLCPPKDGAVDRSDELRRIIAALYGVYTKFDCEMLEVNPLVLAGGSFLALDATAAIDEDALFRQAEMVRPRGQSEAEFELEKDHRKRGWTFLRMEGDIGILSSGAGITMAILDLMRAGGGRPANFLDTAQMNRQGIYDAFHLFLDDPAIKTVLVNIFAGLNRCDDLALGIQDFMTEYRPSFPVVVRMVGNREDEGREILRQVGIEAIAGLEDSVTQVIKITESLS
ncbi:MAG: succinate--CoA ligase subunit beta [Desulfarculus sp.]|nr:succinate--CoA ligase subunit beta [Pseudomonadota bacterium]MBV1716927.1 succinate--CoA ligase subunit beta [Desulfarculus sp.]MBU4574608.1 succinate--CoA ligase subunit beta [Pseudomonadota bacterium]MBU4596670.1 succinate--CoA ligase subunit beta [Pseudomonadota bacterium]MBV1738430.1 succinate--CoA ligase subunit beta [Desulfarculus sp.]